MKLVAIVLVVSFFLCILVFLVTGCASPALPNNVDASLRLKIDTSSQQPVSTPATK